MELAQKIAQELNIKKEQVETTIELLDTNNTVPFIARYRKEQTGNLDDTTIRLLQEKLNFLRNLEQRKSDILRLIEEQGKLTEELEAQIIRAEKLTELEDLYLPFKPKKRTRATIAKEMGAEPLSELILANETDEKIKEMAQQLVETTEIETEDQAYQFAKDIIAEKVSEERLFRDIVRNDLKKSGRIVTEKKEENPVYEMYYEFEEKISEIKPHRILAIFRGEKENILRVKFETNDDYNIFKILRKLSTRKASLSEKLLEESVKDSYKRLLFPSIETEIRGNLKEYADLESIAVFKTNVRPYFMQPPIKETAMIGLDPGYRTGCKVACISAYGEFLDSGVIYVAAPKKNIDQAKEFLRDLIEKYNVKLIAIGNGTASRETEEFVAELIKGTDLHYAIVNEAGASIYSASKLAKEEFPNLDVTIRGAISIARRIQDPLAELVKISPEHIGVGQYQHDVNQKLLKETLEDVVEQCVNDVGVNINTASAALLNYVSGITKTTAQNILSYKREKGYFKNRQEIKEVKGIGPKAFEQCAGFLRIPESDEILDNTEVHPESYPIAKKLIGEDLETIDIKKKAIEFGVGEPTLQDIVTQLKKPGRDPRDEMPEPILKSDILSIDDLEEGMILKGTVRNVVDFGAFVDIGIKQDGLVHISKMSKKYIRHPKEIVQVSDIVTVKIIGIDRQKGTVQLSMVL